MNRLLNIGFVYTGHWKLVADNPSCQLINHGNTNNILYTFISNDEIKYVGKIIQVLQRRMYA